MPVLIIIHNILVLVYTLLLYTSITSRLCAETNRRGCSSICLGSSPRPLEYVARSPLDHRVCDGGLCCSALVTLAAPWAASEPRSSDIGRLLPIMAPLT